VIAFQAGATPQTVPRPGIKTLLQEPLPSTTNQELYLLRLTLPPGARSEARTHSGPGVVYVLEGKIETSATADQSKTYGIGDLFLEPANRIGLTFTNSSSSEPAKLLLFQVGENRGSRSAQ
jgi:quercetin dioxygenase-like cupin family protein